MSDAKTEVMPRRAGDECEENQSKLNLGEAIRRRFAPWGGVDLELSPPEPVGEPPSFDL